MREAMKTAAFEAIVFEGKFDLKGNPKDGVFYTASNQEILCGLQNGVVCKKDLVAQMSLEKVLNTEEKQELTRIFAQAEELRIEENPQALV